MREEAIPFQTENVSVREEGLTSFMNFPSGCYLILPASVITFLISTSKGQFS